MDKLDVTRDHKLTYTKSIRRRRLESMTSLPPYVKYRIQH